MPKIVPWSTVQCTNCGTDIHKRETDIARNKTKRFFCSLECRNKVGSKPRRRSMVTCSQCSFEFYPWSDEAQFCSRHCANEAQRRGFDIECKYCGKPFHTRPSITNRGFCSRECWIKAQYRRPLDRMHNDKPAVLDHMGYVRVYEPGHPAATRSGWIFEHRLVVEQILGRYLRPDEHVHHLNHIRHDNRIENLQRLSHSEHSLITGTENGNALRMAVEMRQKLDEYERRFGLLE